MSDRILYTPKEKKKSPQKRNLRSLWIIGGTVIFILLCAGTIYVTRLSALQIKHISIVGLEAISTQDVQSEVDAALADSFFVGLIPYRFLLAAPLEAVAQGITRHFPLIADVAIEREFPDTLAITVRERKPFGIICNDAPRDIPASDQQQPEVQCAYIDTTGVAYQQAPRTTGFLIIKISTDDAAVTVGNQMIDKVMMRRMIDVGGKIHSAVSSSVVSYQLLRNTPRELRVTVKEGFSLILNRDDDLNQTLSVLRTLLEKEIKQKRKHLDYIDLRFGNKVFYKMK